MKIAILCKAKKTTTKTKKHHIKMTTKHPCYDDTILILCPLDKSENNKICIQILAQNTPSLNFEVMHFKSNYFPTIS